MSSIRIWTLESDNDAKAAGCLANKLTKFMKLGQIPINTSGRRKPSINLEKAVQNYLKRDDCLIIIIDRDGPRAHSQRLQDPDSLLNQIKRIEKDKRYANKVFLVEAVQELEAWLLIDCLGIFCYYAAKRAQFRENCRSKVSANRPLKRLADRYQKGNTENIVEVEQGGRGAKEYLTEFSERVLRVLNPNLTQRNIDREKYQETRSPEVAEHIEINKETLRRNNSLKKLGDVIAQFQ
ncbi:hypothetical protein C6501_01160 [Candidatus Poribacteria bacterium]|nr:MAG: hypothetical protein C6501_01160 [Candidatus Poribacteria bacterium]